MLLLVLGSLLKNESLFSLFVWLLRLDNSIVFEIRPDLVGQFKIGIVSG
jgi:hypothetical protein